MKKVNFKIRDRYNGDEILQEVIAEEYDEFVYYVSPRTNKDFRYNYSFYDKKTGLMVCTGKNKRELLDNYNNLNETYARVRGYVCYKKYIEQYEQLKKEENKNEKVLQLKDCGSYFEITTNFMVYLIRNK